MVRRVCVLFCGLVTVAAVLAAEPKVELLWPEGAPGAVGTEEADKPSLTIWLPPADKATGAAVVICPGGAYGFLAVGHEGKDVAAWLNSFIYQSGGHGFGLAPNDPVLSTWPGRCEAWMRANGWLKPAK